MLSLGRRAARLGLAANRQARRHLLESLQHHPRWPEMAEVLQANPQLADKVLHHCHRVGLRATQRSERVVRHHELARALFGPAIFRQAHIDRAGFLLCQLALPGGHGLLPLRLNRVARYWAEGELTLTLHDPFGTALHTLTFSFDGPDDHAGMLVGSVVGASTPDNIRHLTRLMQGLRPPSLLVFVAQALCRSLGLSTLRAVTTQGHIFAGSGRARLVRFDYDGFWREHGGTPLQGDALLVGLPVRPELRAEADIPSRKRALYRRRFEMLEQLERSLNDTLRQAHCAALASG